MFSFASGLPSAPACQNISFWRMQELMTRSHPPQVTLLESHLSENISVASGEKGRRANATQHMCLDPCEVDGVCVGGAQGDDKAIKTHMSNINCFDLFPFRLAARCRQGTFLIWSENSVKVGKILEGRQITKVSFILGGTNSNDLEYFMPFPGGRKVTLSAIQSAYVPTLTGPNLMLSDTSFYMTKSKCNITFNKILIMFKAICR